MIFPSPYDTFFLMFKLLGEKSTYGYLGFSLIRLLIGFGVSVILAFLLGILVNNNESLYQFFTPIMTFLKAAPTATFVFLFVVLFTGKNAPVFVVIIMSFPILYESVVGAFKSTDQNVLEASKIDGAGRLKTLIKVQIPLGIPYISIGFISTFALAFKVEIMAEIITGITKGGIGTMMNLSQILNPTDMTPMFAYSLIAILLILIVQLIATILKQRLLNMHENGSAI